MIFLLVDSIPVRLQHERTWLSIERSSEPVVGAKAAKIFPGLGASNAHLYEPPPCELARISEMFKC